jgi:hypothetical protein
MAFPVLLKNTPESSDETQSTLACIDWVSSAKHGIACRTMAARKSPASMVGFSE